MNPTMKTTKWMMLLTLIWTSVATAACGSDGAGLGPLDDAPAVKRMPPVVLADAAADVQPSMVRPDAMLAPQGDTMPVPEPDAMASKPDTMEPPVCMPQVETCNGKDDDCDGIIDNDARTLCGHPVGRFGDSVYLMVGVDYTWLQARDACARLGYELASIETQAEWNTLVPWLIPNAYGGRAWLGLRRESTSAPWMWLSGEAVTFAAWLDGQPNNATGDENCVDLRVDASTEKVAWSDRPCDGDIGAQAFAFCEAK